MTLHSILLFLHILSVAAWLAAALWVAGDVRRTLALGRPHVDVLATRIRPALGLDAVAGIATLVTGGLLLWDLGTLHPRPGIAVGMVLALLRLFLLAGMRSAWRGVLERLRSGEALTAADPAAKRMSKFAGIAHVLWLGALAGMVIHP